MHEENLKKHDSSADRRIFGKYGNRNFYPTYIFGNGRAGFPDIFMRKLLIPATVNVDCHYTAPRRKEEKE